MKGDREVATIGFFHDQRGINRMKAELEKTQMQLLQSEKMASLGKLAAGVAHQLNNPLSGITLFTRLVLEDYNLEEGARKDLLAGNGGCRTLPGHRQGTAGIHPSDQAYQATSRY